MKTLTLAVERLASLGIIGTQLRASLKPINTIMLWWCEGFQGSCQFDLHETERRQSLGQIYTCDPCWFSSLPFWLDEKEKPSTHWIRPLLMRLLYLYCPGLVLYSLAKYSVSYSIIFTQYSSYTRRNPFGIALIQTKFGLYNFHFPIDLAPNGIHIQKRVITIQIWFGFIILRKNVNVWKKNIFK